jgi:hypothetical protein
MIYRAFAIAVLSVAVASPARAQLSQDARFEILRTVIAQQAASRITLPRSADGVEVNDGKINQEKVTKQSSWIRMVSPSRPAK